MTAAAARTQRIRALLDAVAMQVTPERYEDVAHYLREEEWQLAVELLAESLDERDAKLSSDRWAEFSELAKEVRLNPAEFSFIRADPT